MKKKKKKIPPPMLVLMCLIMMALLRWRWPVKVILGYPASLMGLAPLLAGLGIGVSGVLKFLQERTNIHPFRKPDKLVMAGVFRYSRNPMYLGWSFFLAGAWILLGAVSPIAGVIVFVAASSRWYIPGEERILSEKFGKPYEDYRAKVRRWL